MNSVPPSPSASALSPRVRQLLCGEKGPVGFDWRWKNKPVADADAGKASQAQVPIDAGTSSHATAGADYRRGETSKQGARLLDWSQFTVANLTRSSETRFDTVADDAMYTAAECLRNVCTEMHDDLIAMSDADWSDLVGTLRRSVRGALCQSEVALVALELLAERTTPREKAPTLALTSFLSVASLLESTLANTCYTLTQTRPMLFRDLLLVPKLASHLGHDLTFVLRVFMGPPNGLNLRNVCWHGFVGTDAFSPAFAWFAFLLCDEIARKGAAVPPTSKSGLSFDTFPLQREPPLSPSCAREAAAEILPLCSWLPAQRGCMLRATLALDEELWEAQSPLASYFSVVALLPQLEHLLRLAFVHLNDCPLRLLTAEAGALYTTLDQILAKTVSGTGSDNRLFLAISEPTMEMAFDLLQWESGPRVRDRLSHGDAVCSSVTSTLRSLLWDLTMRICAELSGRDASTLGVYVPRFHPFCGLARELDHAAAEMRMLCAAFAEWEASCGAVSGDGSEEPLDLQLYLARYRASEQWDMARPALERLAGPHRLASHKPTDESRLRLGGTALFARSRSWPKLPLLFAPAKAMDTATKWKQLVAHVQDVLRSVTAYLQTRLSGEQRMSSKQWASCLNCVALVPLLADVASLVILSAEHELVGMLASKAHWGDDAGMQGAWQRGRGLVQIGEKLRTRVLKNQWAEGTELLGAMLGVLLP